jgi:ankyrin repeat protein
MPERARAEAMPHSRQSERSGAGPVASSAAAWKPARPTLAAMLAASQRRAGNRATARLARSFFEATVQSVQRNTTQQGASTSDVSVARTKAIQRNGYRSGTVETTSDRRARQERERQRLEREQQRREREQEQKRQEQQRLEREQQRRERGRDINTTPTHGRVRHEPPPKPDIGLTAQQRLEERRRKEKEDQDERDRQERERQERERRRKEKKDQDEQERQERERREQTREIASNKRPTYSSIRTEAPRNRDIGLTTRQRSERERKEKEDQDALEEAARKLEERERKRREKEDQDERERLEWERLERERLDRERLEHQAQELEEQERKRKEQEEQARKDQKGAREPEHHGPEAPTDLEAQDRREQQEWERQQAKADLEAEEKRKSEQREKIANQKREIERQKREKASAVAATQPGPAGLQRTDLHIAVLAKNLRDAKSLVDAGDDPFERDADGKSAWTAAVDIMDANSDFVREMLRAKKVNWASKLPDVKRDLGDTALHFAAGSSAELTKLLLNDDPRRVKAKDKAGKYPLAYATDETLGRETVDLLQEKTQEKTLLPLSPSASASTPSKFEAMIYVQDEKHRSMFKGFAAESYKAQLLKPLIDSLMALKDRVADFKIIGSSDESIWNAAVVPGLKAGQKSNIAGWTPRLTDPFPERVYYSAGIKEETVGVKSTARDKWGTLLHEATHAMMMRIFKEENGYSAAPFSPGMVNKASEPLKDAFIKIVNEIHRNLASLPEGSEARAIKGAFADTYTKENYPAELIVRVPQILGETGADEGEKWLRKYVPTLLDFWTTEVVPRLQEYAASKQ